MAQEQKDITPEELDARLDQIFGMNQQQEENETEANTSVLSNLDSLVLTLDWEISDESIANFLSEVATLRESFAQDKISTGFLKLLSSLGKYVQKRKGESHPKAINLIQTVYADLKKIVDTSPDLSEKEKRHLLVKDVEYYNELKAEISEKKSSTAKQSGQEAEIETSLGGNGSTEKSQEPVAEPEAPGQDTNIEERGESSLRTGSSEGPHVAEVEGEISNKDLLEAVEDLKDLIREEFQLLRNELRSLRKRQ